MTEAAAPRPRLVVLAGPTAVGKGTVAAYVRDHHPEVWLSVSATTRAPRPGERDGVHYHFLDRAEFERRRDAGEFLEWATVHGTNLYGTPRTPVELAIAAGRDVLFDVDWQGGQQIRASALREAVVSPAAPAGFFRRLSGRGEGTERMLAYLNTHPVSADRAQQFASSADPHAA